MVVDGRGNPLSAAEVALSSLHRDMTQQKLNLLQLAPSGPTEASATPPEIMRREFAHTNFRGELLGDVPASFSVTASPQTLPAPLTRRKSRPVAIPAGVAQSFNRRYTQSGTGIVRT
jgi:hypothetical protein